MRSSCRAVQNVLLAALLIAAFLAINNSYQHVGIPSFEISWTKGLCHCANSSGTVSCSHADFELARRESLGFFTDITTEDWEVLRSITMARVNYAWGDPKRYMKRPAVWYQLNFDPTFSCRHDTRVGIGDGGKWICDPLRLIDQSQRRKEAYHETLGPASGSGGSSIKPGCIIYSIGSEGDFAFEEGIYKMLGNACEIHTFDFTDYSDKIPTGLPVHFHAWGLKPSYIETMGASHGEFGQKTTSDTGGVFKTLQQTVNELGHAGMPIDLFKIDCEGCEWSTYKDWLEVDIRQILLEVHYVPEVAPHFFEDTQKSGYVVFHKEPNIMFAGGECVEYSFLKLHKAYVEDLLNSSSVNLADQKKVL